MQPAPYPKPSYLIAALAAFACLCFGVSLSHESQNTGQSRQFPGQLIAYSTGEARFDSFQDPPPGSTPLGVVTLSVSFHRITVLGRPVVLQLSQQYEIGTTAEPSNAPHQIPGVNALLQKLAADQLASFQNREMSQDEIATVLRNHPPLSKQNHIQWPEIARVAILMLEIWPCILILFLLVERARWVIVFRRAKRQRVCPLCRYSLAGIPSGICPECGPGSNPLDPST